MMFSREVEGEHPSTSRGLSSCHSSYYERHIYALRGFGGPNMYIAQRCSLYFCI
ncbi:hypothetical protein BGZ61DRAFT_468963 [Ilyonectria robusta]|uniref:uncharacterized protein n=1 Tax=Ilyonectria robusta TaxID=1079257 RepID=UPI001E8DFBDC|nr:uncharacterized protein BGZ61DRAFT_468963 [Ilyonectria robusta]KAH8651697.1 hypothetical protein BGZ61DRAFT_468963 [Ilyonectria robusta]